MALCHKAVGEGTYRFQDRSFWRLNGEAKSRVKDLVCSFEDTCRSELSLGDKVTA